MTSSSIDTADAKWQVDSKYAPDKSSSWTHPIQDDGWMHAHNALRRELEDILKAVSKLKTHHPKTPQWAIESLHRVWSAHTVHVKGHHMNEDNIANPAMKKRINLPDKLESDHEDVMEKVENITNAINALEENDSIDKVENAILEYKNVLIPHLLEEEEIALPLFRSYFSPQEWIPVQREIMKKAKPIELGSFIYYQTEQHFREKFMKQEGIPFFVWQLVLRSKYQYFLNHVKAHLDALETGVPVLPKKKALLC